MLSLSCDLYQGIACCEPGQAGRPAPPDPASFTPDPAQRSAGNYAAARPLYERALAIRERALGPDHPDTAQSLHNLAELFRVQGNYAAAEQLMIRALRIYEARLGPDHPDTQRARRNLAAIQQRLGGTAPPLWRRILGRWRSGR
ncbi:MAG: tetratricopeptide repeat protein [Oscillochloridaceae bacterium]|nr:tetratricopeptide repeat protein [Chloroflexaceae bacterium]MDW8389210.1 tetratricopeptide repeat protein [Oscillochloridaceae bacterium]